MNKNSKENFRRKSNFFNVLKSIVHGIVTEIKQKPVIYKNKTNAEKKIIQCSICVESFASGRNLKMHINSIHKGKKPLCVLLVIQVFLTNLI